MEANLNINNSECILKVSHFGYERVHNVCSGTLHDVPWGYPNWVEFAGASALMLFSTAILLGCCVLVYALITDK